MTDYAGIVTAVGSFLVPVGGGIGFIWNKVEKRFGRIEKALDDCHSRENRTKDRAAGQLTVIELLWMEVRRLLALTGQTESAALTRAKKLMDGMKIDLPDEDPALTALARRLDDRGQA